MLQWFLEGFGIGLSIGLTCAITCGPVVVVFILRRERTLLNSLRTMCQILLGRLSGYILFGLIFGLMGGIIPGNTRAFISHFAFIILGAILVYWGIEGEEKAKCPRLRFPNIVTNPVLVGFFTGIEICPPFLLAITRAGTLGGPIAGAVLFTGFFVGTSIFLIPAVFFGAISNIRLFRIIAGLASIIVGVWFFGNGVLSLYTSIFPTVEQLAGDEFVIGIPDAKSIIIVSNDDWGDTLKSNISSGARISTCRSWSAFPLLSSIEQTDSTFILWLEPALFDSGEVLGKKFPTVVFTKEKSSYNLLQFANFLNTYYFRKRGGQGFVFKY